MHFTYKGLGVIWLKLQWNLSIVNTFRTWLRVLHREVSSLLYGKLKKAYLHGTEQSVLNTEMSLFQGYPFKRGSTVFKTIFLLQKVPFLRSSRAFIPQLLRTENSAPHILLLCTLSLIQCSSSLISRLRLNLFRDSSSLCFRSRDSRCRWLYLPARDTWRACTVPLPVATMVREEVGRAVVVDGGSVFLT